MPYYMLLEDVEEIRFGKLERLFRERDNFYACKTATEDRGYFAKHLLGKVNSGDHKKQLVRRTKYEKDKI
jgi:hypothetical protein